MKTKIKAVFADAGTCPKGYTYQWHIKFSLVGELTWRETMIYSPSKGLNMTVIREMLRKRFGKIDQIIQAIPD